MPDDVAELVAAAQDGDRDAFDELVRATYADTYTLAYRLTGDEEDARDVVQEAYLRAYRGLKRFRGDAQFSTWLYRITANCASTHLGKRTPPPPRRARRRRAARRRATPSTTRRPGPTPRSLRDRLHDALARPAAQAAGRRRAPRRLRPAPRGHRRRARHLRVGGQGAAPPGPPQAARAAVPAARRAERRRGAPVRCDDLADVLAAGGRRHGARSTAPPGATSSAACAARPSSCSTASCCGRCTRCAPRSSSPRPGLLTDILASLEEAGERHAIRSLLSGRRVAYLGGIAAATAAGAAGGASCSPPARRGRSPPRRLTPPSGRVDGATLAACRLGRGPLRGHAEPADPRGQ